MSMRSRPLQERAIAKIEKLIAAAADIFSEDGYETTTSKSIAVRAGVATGTFYQYFDNKDDILCEVARQKFDFQEKALYQSPVGGRWEDLTTLFEDALRQAYYFHSEDGNLHQIIEHRRAYDPELAIVVDAGEARILGLVRKFVASYDLDNSDAVAFTLFAMAEGLIHRHALIGSNEIAKDQALRTGAQLLSCYFKSLRKT